MVRTRANDPPSRRTRSKSKDLTDVPMEGLELKSPSRHSAKKKKDAQKMSEDKKQEVHEEEPPQPISSDSEQETDTDNDKSARKQFKSETEGDEEEETQDGEMSRLFAPYRTIGTVTSGRPFHLLPNENSASAMLCLPIGERFHILQCDKLQPILVSQKVPSMVKVPQSISHLVSDTTLSVTAVAHGREHSPRHITLYARTRPLKTVAVAKRRQWHIIDLLHLGRMKVPMSGEKEGKMENAAIIAAILTKREIDDNPSTAEGTAENIAVVGSSDDDESSDEDGDSSDSDSSAEENNEKSKCSCQVVILLATRETLTVHERISLHDRPTFTPNVALHPSTYVNKIIIGGSDQGKPALVLLNIRSGKVVHTFSCLSQKKTASVTALAQSPAVDTVAMGTSNGKVHLINLRHDRALFSLSHKPRDGGSKSVRITSISFRTDGSAMNYGIAPMAVGRADGTITVWDLNPPDDDDDSGDDVGKGKPRTILCELEKVHPGGVSHLMYLPQEPLMVSIGVKSNAVLMHIFDNPDHSGRILRQRKGHTAPPCKIRYLHPGAGAGGGILVNSADGTDASACQILSSGGSDRALRVFSTARTVLDKEYSQGRGLEKRARKFGMDSTAELLLPPLTAMAMSEARSRDWGDLVTIHENHAMAYVWSTKRGAQSGPVLRQEEWNVSAMKAPPPPSAHAVSVAMSACGNFAVVGTKGGVIYKYNVQSGNTRGSYPRDATAKDEGKGKTLIAGDVKRTMRALEKNMKISNRASNLDKKDQDAVQEALLEQRRQAKLKLASHTGAAVTGIAVDSTNKTLISVGEDSKLILWNFATHAPHSKSPYTLPSPATMLCHVRDSDLAAIALEDFSVILFDCTTLTIVRRFGAGSAEQSRHAGPICDLAFSPDGRALFTASLDGTVRVWDVPTNTCVDWLSFETPPTSLTISPTGEFMATSHTGKLGLSVWSDRSFYQTVNVDGARELTRPFRMDEPRPLAEVWESSKERSLALTAAREESLAKTDENSVEEDSKEPAIAKEEGLITLSNLPPAHWKNLFHLELVKLRNKPKEPPKKPPSAPFFLQWRGGEPMGDQPAATEESKDNDESKQDDEDEWKAAWSDDDGEGELDVSMTEAGVPSSGQANKKRGLGELERSSGSRILSTVGQKKKKISHYRSNLANLLEECAIRKVTGNNTRRFQPVTDHIASMGPSAIDVALSSLCNGMHDLEEGLPLLRLACMWLVEACDSRERYEAVNAYLHRFLHVHATVIAGIEDPSWDTTKDSTDNNKELTPQEQEEKEQQAEERKKLLECLADLRKAQQSALDALRGRMQNSLCLLRHFSRMV